MENPITREEKILNAISSGEDLGFEPITREEQYLANLAGIGKKPEKPITRKEMFLDKIELGGGSSGGASALDSLIDGSITEVTSNATSIKSYNFKGCDKLTTANFPFATSIGTSAFEGCSALTEATFPLVEDMSTYAFKSCSNLTKINAPHTISLGNNTFYGCSKLTEINLPLVTKISIGAFGGCRELTTANFPLVTSISNNAFDSCKLLKTLILRSETMATLSSTNAFSSSSPIASGTGYIYVPRALVDTYKAATNWSTYATQFRALEDYTVDGTINGELDESKI